MSTPTTRDRRSSHGSSRVERAGLERRVGRRWSRRLSGVASDRARQEPAAVVWRRRLAIALGLWAAWYAAYRFYYAFGGEIWMIGRPAPAAQFRLNNLVAAIIILLAAALPQIVVRGWRRRPVRTLLPVVGWVAAVGCCTHAITLEIFRVLSLTGLRAVQYPAGLWLSIDRHTADLQDALLNEPWFLIEGLLWARFALTAVRSASRRRWVCSAAITFALALTVGVLSGLGPIPALRYG